MAGKSAIVIGSGFAGLSAASVMAGNGFSVKVLEKNSSIGGRARVFTEAGFVFDMGPSWYWMPDVFDNYFNYFGKKTEDYYKLVRLDPSYQVIFEDESINIPAEYSEYRDALERLEKGSAIMLDRLLEQAAYKYEVGINNLVYRPSRSFTEFLDPKLIYDIFRLDVFQSFESHINKFFFHRKIKMLMEFPILFLGAVAKNTPALYSLMNYADIKLGTWYPEGGMFKVVEGMHKLALELGVEVLPNQEVKSFEFSSKTITGVNTDSDHFHADVIVASGDYHHVESDLLPEHFRSYSEKYWSKRTLAPSSLIFYLGIGKKIDRLQHHNLFFDADLVAHSNEIYSAPTWPKDPLFYVCAPSKTDHSVAPEGCENLFVLMPVAPGIKDDEEIRKKYFNIIIDRIEKFTGQKIKEDIIYKRSYAHRDFIKDYHSYKGNAYGLANTLMQTAFMKPKIKSGKVTNLYYAGQLTVPGPGVPPSLISGRVVANEIIKDFLR